MEKYAKDNGFTDIRHYTDDGFSGVNFNRPGIQKLIADVNEGIVGTIIVKDMSRFGRNHVMVDFYRKMLFPEKKVRFIAISNNYDSAMKKAGEFDFLPFINIMNEWYAQDTSNKIRAIFKSRMQDGKRCSGAIPYGYYRKPDDKQTLYVDPEAAAVVKRVFEMVAGGIGVTEVAERLTEEGVLIPSAYNELHHPKDSRCHSYHVPTVWNATTVGYILDKREYMGDTVLRKTINDDFKNKKARRKATEEELNAVLEAGTYAPTGEGRQSPLIVAVQSPEYVQKVSYISAALMGFQFSAYYGAPTIILVFETARAGDAEMGIIDASAVCTNMVNAAYAVGLGSCWIHRCKEVFETPEGKALLREWGITEPVRGVASIALGYADCPHPKARARREGYVVKV